MPMIARNPDVHLLPSTIPLGVGADLGNGVIHDPERIGDDRSILTFGV